MAKGRATALLVALVLVWALSWPAIKIGVSSVPPLWYAALRYALAAPLAFGYVRLRGQLRLPPRSDWSVILVSGSLQMACYSALTSVALTILPPGRASVLAFSTQIWVPPLAAWRLREQPSWCSCLGVALGSVGVAIIAAPAIRYGSLEQVVAYILLITAAGAWALAIVHVRSHRFTVTTLELLPWQILLGAMLLLPVAWLAEGPPRRIPGQALATLLYVGPVATALAYWGVVEVSRHVSPTTVSMSLLPVPALGILVSASVFHEPVGSSLVYGMLLIGAGIALTVRSDTGLRGTRERRVPNVSKTSALPAASDANQ